MAPCNIHLYPCPLIKSKIAESLQELICVSSKNAGAKEHHLPRSHHHFRPKMRPQRAEEYSFLSLIAELKQLQRPPEWPHGKTPPRRILRFHSNSNCLIHVITISQSAIPVPKGRANQPNHPSQASGKYHNQEGGGSSQ